MRSLAWSQWPRGHGTRGLSCVSAAPTCRSERCMQFNSLAFLEVQQVQQVQCDCQVPGWLTGVAERPGQTTSARDSALLKRFPYSGEELESWLATLVLVAMTNDKVCWTVVINIPDYRAHDLAVHSCSASAGFWPSWSLCLSVDDTIPRGERAWRQTFE